MTFSSILFLIMSVISCRRNERVAHDFVSSYIEDSYAPSGLVNFISLLHNKTKKLSIACIFINLDTIWASIVSTIPSLNVQ